VALDTEAARRAPTHGPNGGVDTLDGTKAAFRAAGGAAASAIGRGSGRDILALSTPVDDPSPT
jgi:hypothetical protein